MSKKNRTQTNPGTGDGASTAGRAWLAAKTTKQQVVAYLRNGVVNSAEDLLVLTAAALAKDPKAGPGEALDKDDDIFFGHDGSNATPPSSAQLRRRMQVFERVAQDVAAGRLQDWLGDALRGIQAGGIEVALVSIALARGCGLIDRDLKSLSRIQNELSHDAQVRLRLVEAIREDRPLITSGLLKSDSDDDIANRYLSAGGQTVARMMRASDDSGKRRRGMGSRSAVRHGEFPARDPLMRMEQLELSTPIRAMVDTAIAQVAHAGRLFGDWGLGDMVPYGRGTTILLSGPPGVGKTATAEAMAQALGLKLIEVPLPAVQSKYIGECEKAITTAFQAARDQQALLFWDEVDGLVQDRATSGDRPWMISQVTTFLRELERFEGVCILATNRHHGLDAAVDRRLAFRIPFEAPDAGQRRRIWDRFLCGGLPLATDIDRDALAQVPLSGGQIKNVVVNAARRAVVRGSEASIDQADLMQALEWERRARQEPDRPGRQSSARARREAVEPALSSAAPVTVLDPSLPSLRVNTRSVSEMGKVILAMTGVPCPHEVHANWLGRRFLTRNGSLVQVVLVPMPSKQPDVCGLAVLEGGHGFSKARGDVRGSIYMVNAAGQCAAKEPRCAGMDVVAEVLED